MFFHLHPNISFLDSLSSIYPIFGEAAKNTPRGGVPLFFGGAGMGTNLEKRGVQ